MATPYRYRSREYNNFEVTEKLCVDGKITFRSSPCGPGSLLIDAPFEAVNSNFNCIDPLFTAQLDELYPGQGIKVQTGIESFINFNVAPRVSEPDPNCNTIFGYQAMSVKPNYAMSCSAFGYQALMNNNVGSRNNALGKQALLNNTTGNDNCAIGDSAMSANVTGSRNTCGGANVWTQPMSGNDNTLFGQYIFSDTLQQSTRAITIADVGGSLSSTYFTIDTVSTNFYIWININGTGTDPGTTASQLIGSGRIGIGVVVPMNSSDQDIATYIANELSTNWSTYFIAFPTNPMFGVWAAQIINVTPGALAQAFDGLDAPTGFTIVTVNIGSSPGNASENCALGNYCMQYMQSGSRNIGIGFEAGVWFSDSVGNVSVGEVGNSQQSYNVNFGWQSNYNNRLGQYNACYGTGAGLGFSFGATNSANYQTSMGWLSGNNNCPSNVPGVYDNNVNIGAFAGGHDIFGSSPVNYYQDCIAIGAYSNGYNRGLIGDANYRGVIAIGYNCLTNYRPSSFDVTVDNYVLAIGNNAMPGVTSSVQATAIGTRATQVGSSTLSIGNNAASPSNSVGIGFNANALIGAQATSVVIGSGAAPGSSNNGVETVIIGLNAGNLSVGNFKSVVVGNNSQTLFGTVIGHNSSSISDATVIGHSSGSTFNSSVCLGPNTVSTNFSQIVLTPGFTLAATASAGSGPAPPVNVLGYIEVLIGANKYGIPVYA